VPSLPQHQALIASQMKNSLLLKRQPKHSANVSVEPGLTRLKELLKRPQLLKNLRDADKKRKRDSQQLPKSRSKSKNVTDLLKLLGLRLNNWLNSTEKPKRLELPRKPDWLRKLIKPKE
jgi:hypothetical protein